MATYDIVVIGGGPAGLVASKLAAGFGKKVALVEKNKLGGECTLTGCIPSKSLIKSAEVAWYTQNLERFGLSSSPISLDTSAAMKNVREIIQRVYETHTPEKLSQLGIDVLIEEPRFIDKHTLQAGDKKITAKKYIIATGSSPFIPSIVGLEQVNYLTNKTLFAINKLPQSLIILGGGPIGIEMASALNRLGVLVSVIERGNRILPKEDTELVTLLTEQLQKEGVKLFTQTQAVKVSQNNTSVTVECIDAQQKVKKISAQALLIAVGRTPNIQGLNLEKAGVAYNNKGIIVDSTLKTSAHTIYACGDIVGPYQFSHMAEYQATIAVKNALIPLFKQHVNYKQAVWVTFASPELAAAGLTEDQARQQYGDTIKIYRRAYKDIDRARTERDEIGLGKFICNKRGQLVGAHILGSRAGELIHEVQLGKYYKHKFPDFYPVIHAYPTYSDIIWQTSKFAYIENIQNNFWIKILKILFMRSRKQ